MLAQLFAFLLKCSIVALPISSSSFSCSADDLMRLLLGSCLAFRSLHCCVFECLTAWLASGWLGLDCVIISFLKIWCIVRKSAIHSDKTKVRLLFLERFQPQVPTKLKTVPDRFDIAYNVDGRARRAQHTHCNDSAMRSLTKTPAQPVCRCG